MNGTAAATTTYITQTVPPPASSLPTPLARDMREMVVDPTRERIVSYHYADDGRPPRHFNQVPETSAHSPFVTVTSLAVVFWCCSCAISVPVLT